MYITPTAPDGSHWDSFEGFPDPALTLVVNGRELVWSGEIDTFTPTFPGFFDIVVVGRGLLQVSLRLVDEDDLGSDDIIGESDLAPFVEGDRLVPGVHDWTGVDDPVGARSFSATIRVERL